MENLNPLGKPQLKRKTSLSQFEAARKALASQGLVTTNPTPQERALADLRQSFDTRRYGLGRTKRRKNKNKKNKKFTRK